MSWTLCCLVLAFAQASYSQTNVSITISTGPIVGLRLNPSLLSGAIYDAFLGIPYGQIPGRFQPPDNRTSWTTPLATQKDGPACPQPGMQFSEDCLYLNVFTPLDASSTPGKFPVMAFIHGSAFTYSSSSSLVYGPDFIVPQGVILVTMNYRLGAAGFLTLGSSVAPGNLGLLDTQLALRWIQQEISKFGGDPGRVTLAGQSAGSVMTMYHYLSPVSSAMFQRAIAQSGSALSTWGHVTPAEAVHRAKQLADAVGCNTTLNDTQLLSCLQQKDINDIVNHQNITLPIENVASGNQLPFVPVIDTTFGEHAFFTASLENLTMEAAKKLKPLIIGFTTEEGLLMFGKDTWKSAEANLKGFVPRRIQYNLNDNQKTALGRKIESKYFPNTVDQNKVLDIIKLYTDYLFIYPAIDVIKQLSNSTYAYVFAYNALWGPTPQFLSQFISQYHITGVGHGAEIIYLFYSGQDLEDCRSNKPHLAVKDNMVGWWTSFVKGGEPGSNWDTADKGHYFLIDSTTSFVNSSEVEDQHYNFWADLNASALNSSHLTTAKNSLLLIFTTILYGLLKCNI